MRVLRATKQSRHANQFAANYKKLCNKVPIHCEGLQGVPGGVRDIGVRGSAAEPAQNAEPGTPRGRPAHMLRSAVAQAGEALEKLWLGLLYRFQDAIVAALVAYTPEGIHPRGCGAGHGRPPPPPPAEWLFNIMQWVYNDRALWNIPNPLELPGSVVLAADGSTKGAMNYVNLAMRMRFSKMGHSQYGIEPVVVMNAKEKCPELQHYPMKLACVQSRCLILRFCGSVMGIRGCVMQI